MVGAQHEARTTSAGGGRPCLTSFCSTRRALCAPPRGGETQKCPHQRAACPGRSCQSPCALRKRAQADSEKHSVCAGVRRAALAALRSFREVPLKLTLVGNPEPTVLAQLEEVGRTEGSRGNSVWRCYHRWPLTPRASSSTRCIIADGWPFLVSRSTSELRVVLRERLGPCDRARLLGCAVWRCV